MKRTEAPLRAAELEASWLAEGPRSVSVDFGSGAPRYLRSLARRSGKRCQSFNAEGCATPGIGVTGDQHARQDALAKHQPGTALTAAARRKSLGGGTVLAGAFIGKTRAAGAADKKAKDKFNRQADTAQGGSLLPRPSMPQLSTLGRTHHSAPHPPLAVHPQGRLAFGSLSPTALGSCLTTTSVPAREVAMQLCLGGLSEFRRAAGFSGAIALCSGYRTQLPGPVPISYPQHLGRIMEVPWTYPDQAPRVFAPTCAGTVSGDAAA